MSVPSKEPPLTVTCPSCGRALRAAAKAAGHTLPCPACGHPVSIPANVDALEVLRPITRDRAIAAREGHAASSPVVTGATPPPPPSGRRTAPRGVWVVLAIGLVVGGVGGLAFLATRSDERQQKKTEIEDLLRGPSRERRASSDAEGLAACGACGGCWAAICALLLAVPVLNIATAIWVARDARARGMEGAPWILLMVFTGLIGLIVYIFSRPQGNLVPCASCGNKRLQASAVCPHCQHA